MNNTFPGIEPKIEKTAEKKLVGIRLTMSLVHNRTGELWQRFMSRRKEVRNAVGTALYSMQVYGPGYFDAFHPANEFAKWAAVEVSGFTEVPEGMDTYTVPEGLYAVFPYKGSSTDNAVFTYIFNSWLPASHYRIDNRPHFELLGEKYKNASPDSEEDIYIPIRSRDQAGT